MTATAALAASLSGFSAACRIDVEELYFRVGVVRAEAEAHSSRVGDVDKVWFFATGRLDDSR